MKSDSRLKWKSKNSSHVIVRYAQSEVICLHLHRTKKVSLLSGENSITDYQFGKKGIHHYFCKFCGIGAFAKGSMPDGTPMRSVNARCLDDIDIDQFPIYQFDGKSL